MIDPLPKPSPSAVVLVIDDEVKNIQVVGSLLLKHGHEVIAAMSAKDALDKLANTHPDIILLDVMMPGMTGFELCRKLRENPETRDIPVLFLSAAADKNFVVEALDAGAVDYVTKPFHGPELLSRVELHANRRKTHLQLAQVIREKNRLLEIVAHDLKNPLSGIQFAATILDENPNLPDDSRSELVKSIDESAKRAFEILSGLLETSGLQEAKTTISKRPLSLLDHARRAIGNFAQHCKRKDIRIELQNQDEGISVMGESRLLMCCMENLVSNAIKFSPKGSTVTIHLHRDGSGGVFKVTDEGPGIRDDEVHQLFGKFTRLSARPTAGESSTGMGLHIVQDLVTAMDGKVAYQKGSEKGAVFLIELPLVD
jgi:two-component system sensor histidine kinase/response regulator